MKKSVLISIIVLMFVVGIANASPVIDTTGNYNFTENSLLSFDVTTSAPSPGDNTTFTSNFTSLVVTKLSDTKAQVTWDLTGNYSSKGVYYASITANDSDSDSTYEFNITVGNTNRPPRIDVANQNVISGVASTINLSAFTTDDDSDAITYTVTQENASPVDCSVSGETLTILAPITYTSGTATCNVTANDGTVGVDDQFTITVAARAPDVTITQDSALPVLVVYPTGTSTATFNLKVNNTGNVDLTGVNVKVGEFVYSSAVQNITFSQDYTFNIVQGIENSQSMNVSTTSQNFTAGTYTAPVTVFYNGTNETFTAQLSVRGPSYSLSVPSSVDIGGSSQSRNRTVTSSFVITNNGDYSIGNFNVTKDSESKYNMTLSLDNSNWYESVAFSSLAASGTKTVYTKVWIPEGQTSKKVDIGNIYVYSDKINETIGSVTLETETKLGIYDLDVIVDDKSKDIDNGDTRDDVRPGSTVEFKIDVENLFGSSTDIEMEDVEVNILIENIDDDDDMEEESSGMDIKDGKHKSTTLTFDLPKNIDEGKYDVTIEVTGEDEDGGEHYLTWTVYLDVEKKSHEVEISKATLSLDVLKCIRGTSFSVEITNIGSSDEDEVRIEITSPELGIDFTKKDIELEAGTDDDSEYRKTISIDLDRDFKSGSYPIVTKVYYDDDIIDDIKEVTLVVNACTIEVPTTGTSEDSDVIVQTGVGANLPINAGSIATAGTTTTTSGSFLTSGAYVFLLMLFNIAAIGGLAYLAIAFLMKP